MAAKKKSSISRAKKVQPKAKFKVNKWLVLAGVVAVAVIGVAVVRFSSASGCNYAACWSPFSFNGASSGSVVTKSSGLTYWDSKKDSNHFFWVDSSVKTNSYYCFNANMAPGSYGVFVSATIGGKLQSGTKTVVIRADKNNSAKGCVLVPGTTLTGRNIYVTTSYGAHGPDNNAQVFNVFRTLSVIPGYQSVTAY